MMTLEECCGVLRDFSEVDDTEKLVALSAAIRHAEQQEQHKVDRANEVDLLQAQRKIIDIDNEALRREVERLKERNAKLVVALEKIARKMDEDGSWSRICIDMDEIAKSAIDANKVTP